MGKGRSARWASGVSALTPAVARGVTEPVAPEDPHIPQPQVAGDVSEIVDIGFPDMAAEHLALVPLVHEAPFADAERDGDPLAQVDAVRNPEEEQPAPFQGRKQPMEGRLGRVMPVLLRVEGGYGVERSRFEPEMVGKQILAQDTNAILSMHGERVLTAVRVHLVPEIIDQNGFHAEGRGTDGKQPDAAAESHTLYPVPFSRTTIES